MRFPIPDFVPVPSPEVLHMISIVSLIAGVCLAAAAALLLVLRKKKRNTLLWIFMGAGALLILNHGVQLLF